MPRLEVLGREAVEDQNNLATQRVQQQQMFADAEYKAHQAESYALQAKTQAKQADTEEKKFELDKTAGIAKLMADSYKMAVDFATEKSPNGAYVINPGKYQKAMSNFLGSAMKKYPEMIDMMNDLSQMSPTEPPAEDAQKRAQAGNYEAETAMKNAIARRMAMNGGQPGADTGGDVMTGYDSTGKVSFENPAAKTAMTEATQAGMPLNDVEAGLVSKSEVLGPLIDELVTKLRKPGKNVYGQMPAAASRIGAFGEPTNPFAGGDPLAGVKRFFTAGEGRKAGLLLNKIKPLAFGEGGKQLTATERATVMGYLNPQNKTEDQWAEDLTYAKTLLEKKAKLVSQPRGKAVGAEDIQVIRGVTYVRGSDGNYHKK